MVAWKKAVSQLHTTAVQLAADKAQLVALNTTLRSEKCVLESKVEELAAERDRLVSTLQEASNSTNFNFNGNGNGYGNGCMNSGYGSPGAGGMRAFPDTPLSANTLCTRASSIAAAVAAAAAITFASPGTGTSRGLMSAAATPPSMGDFPSATGQQGQTDPMAMTIPSSSPCALSVLASLAATAEPLPLAAIPSTTTSQNPRAADVSGPSPPCLLYTSPSPRDGLLSRMPSSA